MSEPSRTDYFRAVGRLLSGSDDPFLMPQRLLKGAEFTGTIRDIRRLVRDLKAGVVKPPHRAHIPPAMHNCADCARTIAMDAEVCTSCQSVRQETRRKQIFATLSNIPDDLTVVEDCFRAIPEQPSMMRLSDHQAMVLIAAFNSVGFRSLSLAEYGLQAIQWAILHTSSDNLYSVDLFEALHRVMTAFPDHTAFLVICCTIGNDICKKYEGNTMLATRFGFTLSVLLAVRSHRTNAQVFEAAFSLLCTLAPRIDSSQTIADAGGVELFLSIMREYFHNDNWVLSSGLSALNGLIFFANGAATTFVELNGVDLAVSALRSSYMANKSVVEQVNILIDTVVSRDVNARQAFLGAGALHDVFQSLRRYKRSADVAGSACVALTHFVEGNQVELIQEGAITVLMSVLKHMRDKLSNDMGSNSMAKSVIKSACHILQLLVGYDAVSIKVIANEDGAEVMESIIALGVDCDAEVLLSAMGYSSATLSSLHKGGGLFGDLPQHPTHLGERRSAVEMFKSVTDAVPSPSLEEVPPVGTSLPSESDLPRMLSELSLSPSEQVVPPAHQQAPEPSLVEPTVTQTSPTTSDSDTVFPAEPEALEINTNNRKWLLFVFALVCAISCAAIFGPRSGLFVEHQTQSAAEQPNLLIERMVNFDEELQAFQEEGWIAATVGERSILLIIVVFVDHAHRA